MKYNIGDFIKFKIGVKGALDFSSNLGLIIRAKTLFNQPLYEIVVCGNEGKTYFVYEYDVLEKVE